MSAHIIAVGLAIGHITRGAAIAKPFKVEALAAHGVMLDAVPC